MKNHKMYHKVFAKCFKQFQNSYRNKVNDIKNPTPVEAINVKGFAMFLNLSEFKTRKTGELSSGQKNRVSLAKALINDPEILLLDEPTASLDPDVGDYIRTYIETFASKQGATILLASHNMNEVERLCNEVMMMKNGEIIDKGTCNDLIKKHGRKNLEETFLKIVRE